jgi:hypothetical protein
MKRYFLHSALCLSLLLSACDNQKETPPTAPQKNAPAIEKPVASEAAKAQPQPDPVAPVIATPQVASTISGKVLETMNSGGYTYLQVDTGNKQQWVAIPESKVIVGDTVACADGMVMPNFTSKSLNRTFEAIIFSNGLVGKEQGAIDQGGANKEKSPSDKDMANPHAVKPEVDTPPASADSFAGAVKAEGQAPVQGQPLVGDGQEKMASGGSLGAMATFADIKVDKVAGENGYTVEEVFSNGSTLDGKVVRVQGKVVKFSPNIMGKNWIHLQDGSGDPMKNTHDLVVTTSSKPADGQEIIVIEGTVRANKDFGAGYNYVVLVEDATIVK